MPHLIFSFCSRSSRDKDIVHKYGELTLVSRKGKKYKLSKLLVKSTFAMYSENIFLQLLESGNIKTRLSQKKTDQMKSILKQYKISKQLDSLKTAERLTIETLQRHNKIIEEKGSDYINSSNESDEEPLGRGIRVRVRSRKQKGHNKEIKAKFPESEDSSKPIESCSNLNNTHVVSATKSLEVESLPKGLSYLLHKRKLAVKESQRTEIPKTHPPNFFSTKSSYNGNKDTVTENEFEREEKQNIDNAISYEKDWKIPDKIISDKELSFEHDDKMEQFTSMNDDIHSKSGKETEYSLEIVKKREYGYTLSVY